MTIWRMRIACWITKAANTRSECSILTALHGNNGCTNAPQCYVIRTLYTFLDIAGVACEIRARHLQSGSV